MCRIQLYIYFYDFKYLKFGFITKMQSLNCEKNSINGREIKIETTLGHKAKNTFSSFYLYYYLKNTKGITNFTI